MFNAKKFYVVTFDTVIYSCIVFWGLASLITLGYSIYIVSTQNRRNWRLLVLSLAMFVTCVGYLTYIASFRGDPKVGFYAFGIVVPFDIFVHWMFCSIYMKL
jgi:hypothetical protein